MLLKHNTLAILLLLFSLQPIYSQQSSGKRMLSYYKQMVFVELAEQYATVFKLTRIIDPGVHEFSISYIDTLVKQPGSNDMVYEGKRNRLSLIGNDFYLETTNARSKNSYQVKLDYPDSVETVYRKINNAYWFDIFNRLSIELNSRFKWQSYSFRGYHNIDLEGNQRLPFNSFKEFADNRITILRDSLVATHSSYTSSTSEVIRNIGTIEYDMVKNRLVELSGAPAGSGYFNAIIQSVCKSKPEWFYQLADDMPAKKEAMFGSVYGHSLVKNLKAVKTDSPTKNEFIKYKRRDRRFTWGAIGTSLAGAALLGFALITLF